MNPMPDFYRVQMGFSTKHFCCVENCYGYDDGMPFDTMNLEYLRELDKSLGYLSGALYTDELLEKLRVELQLKLGMHIVHTTDVYQDDNNEKQYYMMLSLTVDDNNNKIYSFYNHNDKKVEMKIEPLSYMIKHNIRPLKDSSLNSEFDYDFSCMELPINKPPKK